MAAAGEVDITAATSSPLVPVAVVTDAAGNAHQRTVMETWDGSTDPLAVGPANPLPVSLSSGGIPASVDEAAYTGGTTQGVPLFGVYNDAIGALTAGVMAALRLTLNRQLQVALGASQTDGWTMAAVVAPATPNAQLLKAGQGKIGVIAAGNADTNWTYLKIFDVASPPTLGTTAATWDLPLPPNGGNNPPLTGGLQFTNGCYYAITGGPGLTDNTGITANKSVVNFGFQ